MDLIDVNVLVYAHREDTTDHPAYAAWLVGLVGSGQPFGCSELALSGFVRVVTNPKVFAQPTPLEDALRFSESLLQRKACQRLRPGPDHWRFFVDLCRAANARGKLVPDAYHAALALEHGCDFVTTDSDFARFPGLRWRHPLGAGKPPPRAVRTPA